MQVRETIATSPNTMFWGSGGSKSRLAKAAGAEPSGQMKCGAKHMSKLKSTKHLSFGNFLGIEMSKKRMLLWREARFQVKMYKKPEHRSAFGS